jgi:hypothetical protein
VLRHSRATTAADNIIECIDRDGGANTTDHPRLGVLLHHTPERLFPPA